MSQDTDLRKRSVTIAGHRTSVSLENIYWDQLTLISNQEGLSLNQIVTKIDQEREGNLSSALRVYVLKYNLEK